MKYLLALFLLLAFGNLLFAQRVAINDTIKTVIANTPFNDDDEHQPEFPGGYAAFNKYMSKNLKYPEVARLIGIDGRLVVSFVVNKDGRIVQATPENCIGAGCEAEAVRLLTASPTWKPGTVDGKPVSVMYTIPINFTIGKGKVTTYMKNLRNSAYGFVFNIKGTLYTIDEAQKILGDSFPSDLIELAEPFYNYNKIQKFEMPDKKEVYLLILKTT